MEGDNWHARGSIAIPVHEPLAIEFTLNPMAHGM
jgi:hypothetical protein